MKTDFLIIGAGGMARAIAFDLLNYEPRHSVVLLDRDPSALEDISRFLGKEGVEYVVGDASDKALVTSLMNRSVAAIGASSYKLHLACAEVAVATGTHWVDLGGNPDVVKSQFALDALAKGASVGIVPDAGLAPGLVNVLGGYLASHLDVIDELHFRVGGLPQNPQPPLFYGLVFSPEGLANEYHEPAWVIEEGELKSVESLTGWERIYFGAPLGTLEAFHTSGGASTMVETFLGKVKALDYKTLRYPGHHRKIKLLGDLGFWNEETVQVRSRETGELVKTAPRDVLGALMMKNGFITDDLVVLLAWGIGKKNGKECRRDIKMLDFADPETGLTSMARTTGFPATIIARMLAEGKITARGVLRQEEVVPAEMMIDELAKRGVKIEVS